MTKSNKLSMENRKKALSAALGKIEKSHGKGSVGIYGNMEAVEVETISTGSLGLDVALGVGGYPRGRIIEIFGPEASGKTTLMLHAIAEAQKNGGLAAFVDAEHALDPVYAEALGVNMKDLVFSQPDSGEQALDIVENLIASGALDIIVVDSVAALVPKAEIDGEMGDSHMGLQARLMSQACRKLTSLVSKTGTVLIFINQIRSKIGVMFGCFSYSTRVVLADGSTEKIGKIVNQRMPVEVLSYNTGTGKVEPRKVINWFNNGKADYFLQFVIEKCGGNGRSQFAATPNHTIITPCGEIAAEDLSIGDEVYIKAEKWFGPMQRSVAFGSCLGDGSLRDCGKLTSLRIGHGKDQVAYAQWKAEFFGDLVAYSGPNNAGGWGFDLTPTYDLTEWRHQLYASDGTRRMSSWLLQNLDALALAIWYMDDGTFSGSYEKWGDGKAEISVKSYTHIEQLAMAARIGELLGPENTPTVTRNGYLLFSGERTKALHSFIASYIHPSMEYKLHPDFRGQYVCPPDEPMQVSYVMVPGKIIDIYVKPETRSMQKFDLEVEGNHTYLVDGVAVHNSPETTTGGNALKFYASVRLDIRRTGTIKKGEDSTGCRTKVKVVKNKVSPPFKSCEFDILFGQGVNYAGELVDAGVLVGAVEKSGAWYAYQGERLGQGRDNACQTLRERPEIAEDLSKYVRNQLKLGTAIPESAGVSESEDVEDSED